MTPTDATTTHRGLPLSTHGLVHIYRSEGHDVAALSGVDLSVAGGEMLAPLGPSGAGKSTLLTLLGGLFAPSAGKIYIGHHELTSLSGKELDALRATEVSLMLQGASRNLLPYLTPADNIRFAQRAARRLSGRAALPEVEDVLGQVQLAEHGDVPLRFLTPGHRQLAAVGTAIAADPGVILADEPTSQLDHRARDAVLETLDRINRARGTTIVLVTHDPDVAGAMPRTVTIRDGRIGGEGRAGEEYAVVTSDGFLPLPPHVLEKLAPGTLVRVHDHAGAYTLLPVDEPGGVAGTTDAEASS